ncbi:MAG: hypothetical protein H6Q89_2635, partial [Myxococcaceae bacterium]|nr:hypothetical protein [Myxococcaceae bacterium]
EAGDPVVNADVTAAGRGGDYHSGSSIDGALVVLDALAEGPISIEVSHPDFRPWHRDRDLHPGDNPLEVVLKKGVKLTGKVLDPDGKPVPQAEVEARAPVTAPAIAYSDFDGSFELTFDEAGPQELTASLNTVGRTKVLVHAPADGVVIRLEPRARLRVSVREGNAPVGGASVTVSPVSSETDLNTVSDEAGLAMISGLDTGSYQVTVQSPEFRQPPIAVVNLIEGRTVSLDVVLDRGLTLTGRVVDGRGAPVPGAEVATEPWSSSAPSDEEGRFTLTALDPDGTYQIEATNDSLQSAPLRIKGPQPALQLVMLPRPMVSGRVVEAVTGVPLTRFEVDSQPIEAPDGRFSVPMRAEGQRVLITISADGFETVSWEGAVDASRDIGAVRLAKAKVVEGVVRDARGNPVAGAVVTSDSIDEEVTSGTDGSFRLALSQFEPGSPLVAQRGQLRGSAPIQLGRLIEIILQPPTRVLGQVIDSGGRPVAGMVRLREGYASEELQAEAGSDGAFAIDLAPGRWVFTTRLSSAGQTFAVSGPSMRVVLGAPPGTCAVAVGTPFPPPELMLLPAELMPAPTASFESLATIEGAVLFDTLSASRVLRAAGFRCGPYNLVARWGNLQRVQRIEVRSGGPNEVQLAAPPELSASAPEPPPEAH